MDPLVIMLDKIMENAPYKTMVFKVGKTVTVEDEIGHAVLRNYSDLFMSAEKRKSGRSKKNIKINR